ncbi:MAG: class I SAM-dependent methyltransferase [Truepera sp.]|nr:class I SAM-dependent methyltransferase [Truepera sp.]MBS3968054.1 class I SAM-dependent methyltransferase [Truepera sp.]MBS3968311.1 class I SAM-dependent methyltransferase [Truepera sp.]
MSALVSKSMLLEADLLDSGAGPWVGHIPFAFWIIEQLRPRILVELGTYYGQSYFSLCQSVRANGLSTKCYAVDTWQGDEHGGFYGEEVFAHVEARNQREYHAFSRLLRMRFDDALSSFSDGTIDLLHIDGLHTYEAVRHDFESWLPKLSSRGVVLFHDINVRERDFGVWRLWEELSTSYPHIEFEHSHGLGVLFVGKLQPPGIIGLLEEWSAPEGSYLIKNLFAKFGHLVSLEYQTNDHNQGIAKRDSQLAHLNQAVAEYQEQLTTISHTLAEREEQVISLNQGIAERDSQLASLTQAVTEHQEQLTTISHTLAEREEQIVALNQGIAERDGQLSQLREQEAQLQEQAKVLLASAQEAGALIASLSQTIDEREEQVISLNQGIAERDSQLATTSQTLAERDVQIATILSSTTWRLTGPLRVVADQLKRIRRWLRFSVRKVLFAPKRFDAEWYLKQNPDVAMSGMDPYKHYILFGKAEGRKPAPDTSLLHGKKSSVFHLLRIAPQIITQKGGIWRTCAAVLRVYRREGFAGIKVRAFGGPSLLPARGPLQSPMWFFDIVNDTAIRQSFWTLQHVIALHAKNHGEITHLIALPFFSAGGAQQTATNFACAVARTGGSVLMLAVDRKLPVSTAVTPAGKVLAIDLEEYFPGTDMEVREALLMAMIRMVAPRVLHIINSEVGWRLVIKFGNRIRQVCRVFGSIFAFQYDSKTGAKIGYAETFLRDALPFLDGLLTDNKRFAIDAIADYGLEAEKAKFHVIYNPCRFDSAEIASERLRTLAASIADAQRLQIVWAGRLDAEKRPDLLFEVARLCPQMDFHVFGATIVDSSLSLGAPPANLQLRGPFSSPLDVIRDSNYHAYMFTSRWEGMPNTVIEFGAAGYPVIAATVGGISELIDESTGYPLPARASAADYARSLEAVRMEPDIAAQRAAALVRRIAEIHSQNSFYCTLKNVPSYLIPPKG